MSDILRITDNFVNYDLLIYTDAYPVHPAVRPMPPQKKPAPRRRDASKTAPLAVAPSAPTSTDARAAREPRGARRKRETREKLLEAAFELMAERGMAAVAINEITEAADVGFGSFYNHFESKEAIYSAVLDAVFEGFGDALDHLVRGIEDPAEIVSICVRHVILRARREPLWGRFLVREGFSLRQLSRGLGARLLRDLQIGASKGRFEVPDLMMSFIAAGSGVLGAISAELELANPLAAAGSLPAGIDTQDIPERAATTLLHHLGLPLNEARRIARRPLPVVDRPPSPA
jgi:AcrR family transcriptional regulator